MAATKEATSPEDMVRWRCIGLHGGGLCRRIDLRRRMWDGTEDERENILVSCASVEMGVVFAFSSVVLVTVRLQHAMDRRGRSMHYDAGGPRYIGESLLSVNRRYN